MYNYYVMTIAASLHATQEMWTTNLFNYIYVATDVTKLFPVALQHKKKSAVA